MSDPALRLTLTLDGTRDGDGFDLTAVYAADALDVIRRDVLAGHSSGVVQSAGVTRGSWSLG